MSTLLAFLHHLCAFTLVSAVAIESCPGAVRFRRSRCLWWMRQAQAHDHDYPRRARGDRRDPALRRPSWRAEGGQKCRTDYASAFALGASASANPSRFIPRREAL